MNEFIDNLGDVIWALRWHLWALWSVVLIVNITVSTVERKDR